MTNRPSPELRARGGSRRHERVSGGSTHESTSYHSPPTNSVPGCARGCVRDSRPEGRGTGAPARSSAIATISWRGGDSAPLATVVSLPTAREARPGAQRRDTPRSRVVPVARERGPAVFGIPGAHHQTWAGRAPRPADLPGRAALRRLLARGYRRPGWPREFRGSPLRTTTRPR